MALRIGDITNATSCVGTDEIEFSLAGAAGSRKMSMSNLRKQLFAGGTGFTSTDPITAGAATFTTGSFAGNVTPSIDNTYSLGSASFRWSDFRSVLGTFTSVTGTLLTAAQPNVTSVGTLTGLTITGAGPALTINANGGVSGQVFAFANTALNTAIVRGYWTNLSGQMAMGVEGSAGGQIFVGGSAYAAVIGTDNAKSFQIATSGTVRSTWDSTGLLTTSNGLTVSAGTTAVQALTATTVTAQGFGATGTGAVYSRTGATTSAVYVNVANTSGDAYFGAEGSAGGTIITGSTGYDVAIRGTSGLAFSANNGAAVSLRIANTHAATFTAGITATTGTFTGAIAISNLSGLSFSNTGATTSAKFLRYANTGGALLIGVDQSAGGNNFTGSTAYASTIGTETATDLQFFTNGTLRLTLPSAGGATFAAGATFAGAVSGITTLAGTGAISGFTSCTLNGALSGVTTLSVSSTISGATNVTSNKLTGGGSTPGIAAGAAAGSSPTISITGTDSAGKIDITAGSGPSGTTLATITFATAYAAAPYIVITPGSGGAFVLQSGSGCGVVSVGTTTWVLRTDTLPTNAVNYVFYYHVIA